MTGFDFNVIRRSLLYLFRDGMTFTITLTLLAMTGGIVFGTVLAMMRLARARAVSALAGGYVNLMRSVPLVLVIFWFFFLVPYIGAWIVRSPTPIKVGAFSSALITFTMFEAAYYCEIMRAGIQSIPRGQLWSGYALGLNFVVARGRQRADQRSIRTQIQVDERLALRHDGLVHLAQRLRARRAGAEAAIDQPAQVLADPRGGS